ncbi:MAG: bifunctional 2-polyprenyl-6-hydroxyphenol methylase/3-demethylubiquinol 3-O-methyltransferase UbiG [Pseudomonadota bacterium]|jgi:2-polyprenyl-6-hydroxyphenyl methylase/3-demethylubiquinone-9 3-methyltransferase
MSAQRNFDPAELQRFAALAPRWWDPDGESRPLHDLNPVRVDYIAARCRLSGARVADVGCGGGLLSEALAARAAQVTGLDLGGEVIEVARLHLLESGLRVDYRQEAAETHAAAQPEHYDVVACMEMLEHVPDPGSVVRACASMLRPGGQAFFSTLNRTPAAFAAAIVGAEYLLRLLPQGTHDWSKFIRPSELARALRDAGLVVRDIRGLRYDPIMRRAWLVQDTSVNYLVHAGKPQ